MILNSLLKPSGVMIAASILATAPLPSMAEKWPGAGPAPGGALAARVIGLMCLNALSFDEIYDLDLYLAKKRIEGFQASASDEGKRKFEVNFYPALEAKYIAEYRDGKRCSADETVMAKDMVERVRKEAKPAAK